MPVLPDRVVESLDAYRTRGGGRGLARAHEIGPDAVVAEIADSGLRGRGGGGFPTGRKWRSIRDASGSHRYVVANGAEGEPGTFKDRAIMRTNPYQVVEGAAIAAYAVGAQDIFVGVKASFTPETDALTRALEEMAAAGMLDGLDVSIATGPGEYLFGEETALLEVIEGNEPLPRVLPPYVHGLFANAPQLGWIAKEPEPGHRGEHRSNPTLANNVETLAHAAHVLAEGADAFRARGTGQSPGTTVFTVCGDVRAPGVYELPLGTPMRTLVEGLGGGVPDGTRVKLLCSGVANPVLTASALDTPMDYEALAGAGGGLGSAGFIVYDDTVCALAVARLFSRFLYVESCGQCPPCKLGSRAITHALEELETSGDASQLAPLERALRTVTEGNRCYLAVEEQVVVGSILRLFPEDVVAHQEGSCQLRHDLVLPLIDDFADGRFVYNDRQMRKRPDWTYDEVPVS